MYRGQRYGPFLLASVSRSLSGSFFVFVISSINYSDYQKIGKRLFRIC